jgi:hypothetical protein
VGLPPPVEFSSLRHSHKLSCSWLLGSPPLPPETLWLGPACLFTVPGRIPFPSFGAQGAPPSLIHVFIVLVSYYSVSLFCPGGGSVCPGGYADVAQGCLWEYHVPLSSPCLRLPKLSGHGRLAARGPSWFLHLM